MPLAPAKQAVLQSELSKFGEFDTCSGVFMLDVLIELLQIAQYKPFLKQSPSIPASASLNQETHNKVYLALCNRMAWIGVRIRLGYPSL